MLSIAVMSLVLSVGLAGPIPSPSSRTALAFAAVGRIAEKDIVETAVAAGSFDTLAAALKAADLVDTLKGDGPFTVFAPTDEAFAKLPAGTVESLLRPENKAMLRAVLLYHVVPGMAQAADVAEKSAWATINGQQITVTERGGKVMIDKARVIKADITATNGVIHAIDAVIMPETRTIPAVAKAAGSFGTLLAAVEAAGLSETLMGKGPFTVFAPTDDAFAALGDTVEDLLRPENKQRLAAILTYHVVPGRVFAAQAMELDEAKTVNGQMVDIASADGKVTVGGATVVKADIDAANGVIHVIDAVLLPE